MRRRRRKREPKPTLRFAAVLRHIADGYRYDWRVLLLGGLVVFIPIDLIGAFDLIGDRDWSTISAGTWVAEGGLAFAQFLLPMMGNVLYAGIVAAGEQERRLGTKRNFMSIARSLPYLTLIVADIVLVLALLFGFLLLIIPGVLMLVWFSLLAPVVELERRGPLNAFRRSYRLVRGRFWRVAGIVIPLTILQSFLATLGDDAGHAIFGSGFAGDWIGSVAASLLSSGLWALAILALYLELAGPENEAPEPTA